MTAPIKLLVARELAARLTEPLVSALLDVADGGPARIGDEEGCVRWADVVALEKLKLVDVDTRYEHEEVVRLTSRGKVVAEELAWQEAGLGLA